MASSLPTTGKVRAAVVTGRHPFDVPGFHALFHSIAGIDFYPQHLEDFVADAGMVRQSYDVVVFYNFHQATPGGETGWWEKGTREVLEHLGDGPQGIFVLHHALLAFPQWPLWSEICGIEDRSFGFHVGQEVHVEIASPQHPIAKGLSPWDMVDETYTMNGPGEGSDVLLTTDHPNSMTALAWERHYRNAPVFCCQLGHDNQAYSNGNFRTIVSRGIQWLAGRL